MYLLVALQILAAINFPVLKEVEDTNYINHIIFIALYHVAIIRFISRVI